MALNRYYACYLYDDLYSQIEILVFCLVAEQGACKKFGGPSKLPKDFPWSILKSLQPTQAGIL